MRAGARRSRHGDRDDEREQPLAEVVRLAGIGAHEIAQRPLQEQQEHDRDHEPAPERNDRGDRPIQAPDQPHLTSSAPAQEIVRNAAGLCHAMRRGSRVF
jgi:hypothetical protein